MKKLLIIVLVCLFFAEARSQQLTPVPGYGFQWNRGRFTTLLGLPTDTFTVSGPEQGYPWLALKSNSFYFWNTSTLKWERVSGTGTGLTQVLPGDYLASVNDSTLKLDTAALFALILRRKDTSTLIPSHFVTQYQFSQIPNSGGDTTIFSYVLDSTGQAQRRVLFAGGGNRIVSQSKFLFDSTNSKLGINVNNISQGGPNVGLVVGGNKGALITGDVTGNSFIKIGGLSTQFLKADGSVDANTYATTAQLALKVNISDTNTMLSPYLRKSDTTGMLSPYKHWTQGYIKASDTASMLANYVTTAGYGLIKTGKAFLFDSATVFPQLRATISSSGLSGSGFANRVAFWNGTSSLTSDADWTFDGTDQMFKGDIYTGSNTDYLAIGDNQSAYSGSSIEVGGGSLSAFIHTQGDGIGGFMTDGTYRFRYNKIALQLLGSDEVSSYEHTMEFLADYTGARTWVFPNGRTRDTLATLYDVRAGGGGTTISFPNTTGKYLTGYNTFGSFSDTARSVVSAGIDMIYSSGTGVFDADTTTGDTKLATQGDITRALVGYEAAFTSTKQEFTGTDLLAYDGTTGFVVTVSNTPKTSKERTVQVNGQDLPAANVGISGAVFTVTGLWFSISTSDIVTVKYSY